jgi:hypothetical protein
MNLSDLMWSVVGFLLTVMILSYLIGDNVFFRFAAHLFVGITAGYLVLVIVNQVLWPYLLQPLVSWTWIEKIWLIVPIVLILLLVLGQIPRFAGIGSIPLAYLAGLSAAIAIGGALFGTLIPQSRTIIEAFNPANWYEEPQLASFRIIEAVIMLLGTLGTLAYFHFGRKRNSENEVEKSERPLIFEAWSKVGQVFIGIALGAVFAGLFSSALMALIDRIIAISETISLLFRGG